MGPLDRPVPSADRWGQGRALPPPVLIKRHWPRAYLNSRPMKSLGIANHRCLKLGSCGMICYTAIHHRDKMAFPLPGNYFSASFNHGQPNRELTTPSAKTQPRYSVSGKGVEGLSPNLHPPSAHTQCKQACSLQNHLSKTVMQMAADLVSFNEHHAQIYDFQIVTRKPWKVKSFRHRVYRKAISISGRSSSVFY